MTEKTELHEDEWQRLDVMQSKMRKMLDAYRQDKLPKNKIREFKMLQKEVKKLMAKLYYTEEVELDEAKYDLYHKDFSSAMQHAYAMAKKLHGVTIDPKEIDDKVATGPKKPSKGKTNSYRLKGKGGAIQVQVANLDDKKFELNMYKEEVELDEGRMKELHGYIQQGMSAKEIAKKMKLDVKTIQALMPKKEEVEMEDLDNLIEEALQEAEVKYPHMMYDPKTGEGVEAKTPEDHDKLTKKGYTHEKPELDEMREPYAVVDTADGDKVVGTASDEKGAKSIITTSQLPPMRIKDKKTLKIVKVKKKQMIGQPIKEEKVSMTPFGVSKSLVDAVSEVIAGKKPVSERKDIPEEILDDDVADFIGAASKAAQAGKKTFKFGDKEYPVTIKKDTAKKVAAKMDEEKPTKKEEKKDEKTGKKEPVEIDPPIKEETK
jgi:hypothetical protein